MKNFTLIGHPLGHSLSPLIHKELLKIKGIDANYDLTDINPEDLKNYLENLKSLNGFNVTIPHKINIIPFLDEIDEKAKLFQSVNTVKCTDKLKGYNTDCIGFLRSLSNADIPLCGNVLICGAGGVSRMFAFESVMANCNVSIAVRESGIQKAIDLQKEIKEKLNKDVNITTYEKINDGFDLIINGTPVGMFPKVDNCVISKKIIQKSKAVFDAVYNPLETKFIKYAKDANIKYTNGLSMLVLQAAAADEIWLGVEFTKEETDKVTMIAKKELEK